VFTARYGLNPDIYFNFLLVSKCYIRHITRNMRIRIRQFPPLPSGFHIIRSEHCPLDKARIVFLLLRRGFTHYAVHKDTQLYADGHE